MGGAWRALMAFMSRQNTANNRATTRPAIHCADAGLAVVKKNWALVTASTGLTECAENRSSTKRQKLQLPERILARHLWSIKVGEEVAQF